ncbi:MAG: O-antigen ligase family protein [bacterium]|nr:O-antigen ligase family protein [bacterium]
MSGYAGTLSQYLLFIMFGYIIYRSIREPILLTIPFITSALFKQWVLSNEIVFLGLDYTVFTVFLIGVAFIIMLFQRDAAPIRFPLWASMALGVIVLVSVYTYYSSQGSSDSDRSFYKFLFFGLTGFLSPIILIRRERDLRSFINVLTALITLLVFIAIILGDSVEERARALEGSTITTSIFSAVMVTMVTYRMIVESNARNNILWILLIVFGLIGMLITGSRGPFQQLLLITPFILFINPKYYSRPLIAVAVMVLVVLISYTYLLDFKAVSRTLTPNIEGASIQYRLNAWSFITSNWMDAPILGHGIGYLEARYDIQAHSLMLDLLFSGGLISLVAYIVMVVNVIVYWKTRPRILRFTSLDTSVCQIFLVALLHYSISINGQSLESIRFVFFWSGASLAASWLAHHTGEMKMNEYQRLKQESLQRDGLLDARSAKI